LTDNHRFAILESWKKKLTLFVAPAALVVAPSKKGLVFIAKLRN
jgi:uncharacterized protein (DUF927 family)